MRLSTSTCIHEKVLWGKDVFYSCEESITACVKAGYKVLDMNFATYSRGTLPMTQPDWQDWTKRQRELADSYGVEFSQAHAHFYDWRNLSDEEEAWHEELMRRSIIGAGIVGAKWLVIHPGSVDDDIWYSHDLSLAKNVKAFRKYGDLAAQHNVHIAIENMIERRNGRRYASSTEELLELLDVLDDPMFGICWDTGHAHLAGINQCEALRTIGKKLKALHIADNRGEKDDHIAPYFGTIVWEPIMRTLKEIDYQGDFTYEIHNFTNGLPDGMHEQLIRFTYELGIFMLDLAK
ncbi:MAG: sugar phosphate isomerase/epimerase [Limnochordia bacterium]|nr:sugar phosphate isomerase/epimerase [Limnochordia bacterium]MDD4517212.1 sugar phosphate isomerase/epimerase [Limnochordia bacterium]